VRERLVEGQAISHSKIDGRFFQKVAVKLPTLTKGINAMGQPLEIRVISLDWMEGLDETLDLCAHGNVFVRIGAEVLVDRTADTGWTLSSTALLLLRSLDRDYMPDMSASQLVPCCGFNYFTVDDWQSVEVMGCPSGIDWTIRHEGNNVRHQSADGAEAIVSFDDFRSIVLGRVDNCLG
jgi:hypothetical protein